VTIPYLVPPYGEIYQRSAEFLRQSLGRVGIDLQLQGIDLAGWAEKCSNWDFSMTMNLVYQFGDPALGVSRTYITSNIRKGILFSNTAGYSNPEVDRLFEDAAVATSDARRQELYSAVQKLLVEEVPIVWLIEQDYPNFIDKRLKNVITTAIGVHETFGTVSFG
jgi:peptide/nickel transport system substrate-binding protein